MRPDCSWSQTGGFVYGVGGVAAIFLSLKQLRERNEIYRNTEEKCEPHSFKVQLLQPSMCCSSKGGNFGLAAYPNLENLPRLHLNRLRHIREARGCETIVHLYSIFYNYCLSTPLPKSRCRAVLGKNMFNEIAIPSCHGRFRAAGMICA